MGESCVKLGEVWERTNFQNLEFKQTQKVF